LNAWRDGLAVVQLIVFVGLALAAAARWVQLRQAPRAWMAATFGTIAIVVVAARVIPADHHTPSADLARKFLIAGLALFPYFLYRFAATFRRPARWMERTAVALTAAVMVAAFLVGAIPVAGEPRSASFQLFVLLFMVQWASLTGLVAVRLWRAGRGQPTVARRRMRTLGVGAGAMGLLIVISGSSPSGQNARPVNIITALMAIATGPLFLLGFSPPRLILTAWRRPEELELRAAEASLMAAMTPGEVAQILVPHVARVIGARAAVLTDAGGNVLASVGSPSAAFASGGHRPSGPIDAESGVLTLDVAGGQLTAESSPYTPYFGREEAEVLHQFARLTDVAMQRAMLSERERQLAGELQQANDAMREFVAIASHDLRTPITLVTGFAQLMVTNFDGIDDASKLENLHAIVRQGQHLARLVDDLLTVSRIDAGAVAPDAHEVDLRSAIAEVVADLGAGDLVEVSIPAEATATVMVDSDHLARILRNYIANAMNHGAPPLRVDVVEEEGTTTIRVKDHGAGVPPAFQDRLFERFARSDTARERDKRGTGLGLSIVAGLARAAGGEAWYEPTEHGACFAVRLPR